MKQLTALALACLLLAGCGKQTVAEVTVPETTSAPVQTAPAETEAAYASQFLKETVIHLSDEEITVDGNQESVTLSNDIVYYEDRDTYDSGNPYGEGTDADKHTAEEAAAHTVVNITSPGAYRVTGRLSAGQLRIDLGDDAYYDPEAVVELILEDADITCTVAPAILFQNVYECDGEWSADTASADVDTTAAGANLILEGENTVHGAYVARIYKDAEGEKKKVKQDGAIYSYMSMNVCGSGALTLTAENEGMDTELHLTVNSGDIYILSDNDGINTNEDGVSVTTVNGGTLTIQAGLGAEGDGIDSNGYLVINGGSVFASANPAADSGLDADLGVYIHGGIVVATGSAMDGAHSGSTQATMNLQFAGQQTAGARIVLSDEDGETFFYEDDSEYARPFSGLILSHPYLQVGQTYTLTLDGVEMTQSSGGFGGMGGRGQRPEGMEMPEGMEKPEGMQMPEGEMPTMPEGMEMPEDFDPSQMGGRGQRGEGMKQPENGEMPTLPEGETMPADFDPAQMGEDRRPEYGEAMADSATTEFTLTGTVTRFTGISAP